MQMIIFDSLFYSFTKTWRLFQIIYTLMISRKCTCNTNASPFQINRYTGTSDDSYFKLMVRIMAP